MNIILTNSDLLHPMWEFYGAQASVVEMFDLNRDGRLAQEDFAWSFSPKDTFHEVLVQSFAVTGAFKYPETQPEGLRRALRLFDTIHQMHAVLKVPKKSIVPYADWKLVQEAVDSVAFQLNGLHLEMATVAQLLSGKAGISAHDREDVLTQGRGVGPNKLVEMKRLPQVWVNYCALQNDMGLDTFTHTLTTDYNDLALDILYLSQIQCQGNGCLLGRKYLDTDALLIPLQVTAEKCTYL